MKGSALKSWLNAIQGQWQCLGGGNEDRKFEGHMSQRNKIFKRAKQQGPRNTTMLVGKC